MGSMTDWKCTNCGWVNRDFATLCVSCGQPRPEGSPAPGYPGPDHPGQGATPALSMAEAQPFPAAPEVPAMLPCYICGRGPTAIIKVTRGLGMVLARRDWVYQAPLCRDHGTAIARNWLVATALMGWWGIVSFFVNWVSVAQDIRAWLTARRLAPAGSVVVPSGFGWTAPVASPHVPRAQLAAFAALIVVLAGFLIYNATYGSRSVTSLAVGNCFNDPGGVADTIDSVTNRPCTEAHDSEVFAVVSFTQPNGASYPEAYDLVSQAERLCVPHALTYIGNDLSLAATLELYYLFPTREGWQDNDRRLVCYFHNADGPTLTHSLRSANPS